MAKAKRTLIRLECPVCKNQNYITEKNPDNASLKAKGGASSQKLVLKKYCKHCRKITEHKEAKV